MSNIDLSFIDSIPGSNLREKLQHVANCNCCERHQINKPRVLAPWVDTPSNNSNNHLYRCNCDCRHLARFICRACDQEEQPEEVITYYASEPDSMPDEDIA